MANDPIWIYLRILQATYFRSIEHWWAFAT